MKRKDALILMRAAGFHQDRRTFTRVCIEARVSYTKATEEYQKGDQMRKDGVKCSCNDCEVKRGEIS